MNSYSLFFEFVLDGADVNVMSRLVESHRDRCSHARSLTSDSAGHHVPHGGVAGPVPRHRPPRHQQVLDPGGNTDAIGNLEISARTRQDQDVVSIYKKNL